MPPEDLTDEELLALQAQQNPAQALYEQLKAREDAGAAAKRKMLEDELAARKQNAPSAGAIDFTPAAQYFDDLYGGNSAKTAAAQNAKQVGYQKRSDEIFDELSKLKKTDPLAGKLLSSQEAALSRQQRAQENEKNRQAAFDRARLMVGSKQENKGSDAVTAKYADDYVNFAANGGAATIQKDLDTLKAVRNKLAAKGAEAMNPLSVLPKGARDLVDPENVALQEELEGAIQSTLKSTLGTAFTEGEGQRVLARAFNPKLPPAENLKRVDAEIKKIEAQARAKIDAANYFEQNGSLKGFKGSKPNLSAPKQPPPTDELDALSEEELDALLSKGQ